MSYEITTNFVRNGVRVSASNDVMAKGGRWQVWLDGESICEWEGAAYDNITEDNIEAEAMTEVREWLDFATDEQNYAEADVRPVAKIELARRALGT